MQNEMRSQQGKTLKRGRKSKKSGDSKTNLKKKKSKRNILKAATGNAGKAKAPKKHTLDDGCASGSDGRKKRKSAPKPVQPILEKDHHAQGRIGDGKKWQYEILPNQVFGCRSCRFIYGGCQTCQKPTFRGLCAAQARLQQQELKDAEQEIPQDAGKVEVKKQSTTAAKKVKKKGKKAKKYQS